jgi:signal transduction histidine kinase
MTSFRSQIVASTVLLVTAVMVAVVLGTQLVLELGERHPEARSPWNILLATGLVGACGVVLSGWVAWRVSHRALKPVRDMAERAEDWSAQNLARRFDPGPPVNELSQLGQTLDHLLDRVAHAIRAEQRLSAELAHEIRIPLAAIRGSAELALLRKPADPELRTDLAEIADGTRRLAEVVTTLLELAQNPGEALTGSAPLIAGPLVLVAPAWRRGHPGRAGPDVEVPHPPGVQRAPQRDRHAALPAPPVGPGRGPGPVDDPARVLHHEAERGRRDGGGHLAGVRQAAPARRPTRQATPS